MSPRFPKKVDLSHFMTAGVSLYIFDWQMSSVQNHVLRSINSPVLNNIPISLLQILGSLEAQFQTRHSELTLFRLYAPALFFDALLLIQAPGQVCMDHNHQRIKFYAAFSVSITFAYNLLPKIFNNQFVALNF